MFGLKWSFLNQNTLFANKWVNIFSNIKFFTKTDAIYDSSNSILGQFWIENGHFKKMNPLNLWYLVILYCIQSFVQSNLFNFNSLFK